MPKGGAAGANEASARVLALLSGLAGQELHTREIIRRTKDYPTAVQRALTGAERRGLIESRRVGNLRLWRMDPANPLYASLREMFARTRGVPARLAEVLGATPEVKLALLFGSYVTAQDDPTSDIDLLVVGAPDWVKLSAALREAGRQLGRQVNPIVWSERDLAQLTPAQVSFLDSLLAGSMMWLVGGPDELKRLRTAVVSDVGRRGAERPGVPTGRAKSAGEGARSSGRRQGKPSRRASGRGGDLR